MAHARGRRWERFVRAAVARQAGLCWCGHGGARQGDHVISVADRPDLEWAASNICPAHGAPGNPCPVCSVECGQKIYCNQLRGAMSVERALRIIAEKREAHQGARPPAREMPDVTAGRPW